MLLLAKIGKLHVSRARDCPLLTSANSPMADLTPDQEAALLESLANACRSAGYIVEAIDRGLEVSGADEEDGAYYVLADFSAIDSGRTDREFAVWLAETVGVATVPGTSFYGDPGRGTSAIRFAFCKTAFRQREDTRCRRSR